MIETIETIRMGHVLREAVAAPYRNLVTRSTGAAVRSRIEAALDGSECLCAYLDFSDIDLLDLSCADEVVAKLLLTEHCPRYVVLQGLREDQHEAIDHVLAHHRLAVTAVPTDGDAPRLLGWATPDAHAAFACIREDGPLSAAALAERLEWSDVRACQALGDLTLHRLVRSDGDLYYPLPAA